MYFSLLKGGYDFLLAQWDHREKCHQYKMATDDADLKEFIGELTLCFRNEDEFPVESQSLVKLITLLQHYREHHHGCRLLLANPTMAIADQVSDLRKMYILSLIQGNS